MTESKVIKQVTSFREDIEKIIINALYERVAIKNVGSVKVIRKKSRWSDDSLYVSVRLTKRMKTILKNKIMEYEMGIDKHAARTNKDLVKKASKGKLCPKCGSKLIAEDRCPKCGTEPFEVKDGK